MVGECHHDNTETKLQYSNLESSSDSLSDFNNDRIVDISDAVASLNYLFSGGEPPAAPGPPEADCGNDTDAEGSLGDLGCDNYAGC